MSPIEIVLFAFLVLVMAVGGVYATSKIYNTIHNKLEESADEEQGSINFQKRQRVLEMRCIECGKLADPDEGDVFINNTWLCVEDFDKMYSSINEDIDPERQRYRGR